ncbi:malonate transporter subunit MadL [Klebsiella pneumoniae]|nr:malonate transporter subunit MadL [Klebsiella pneumoniae]MDL4387894.1 malonate transporter subunit MadL [Klebsiella pneumoniae]MDL4514689.1 malonate transporter subunit MadL [Klebsiella pneumoniae]MDL4525485.1 malonate transporter subunit MadL [Klebsiella pneumoniae]
MIIYGLMLMGLCMFAGLIVGDLLGLLLGISANIGGVGFAMLFLVVISQKLTEKGLLSKEGANKQVISSQADSLIKISRIWADFFPANTSN